MGLGLEIKMRKDGSIYVTRVHLPQAMASGIEVNDTILAINDQPLKALHFTQVIDIVRSIPVGIEVKIKYAREKLMTEQEAPTTAPVKSRLSMQRATRPSSIRHLRKSVFVQARRSVALDRKPELDDLPPMRGRAATISTSRPKSLTRSIGACEFRALPQLSEGEE